VVSQALEGPTSSSLGGSGRLRAAAASRTQQRERLRRSVGRAGPGSSSSHMERQAPPLQMLVTAAGRMLGLGRVTGRAQGDRRAAVTGTRGSSTACARRRVRCYRAVERPGVHLGLELLQGRGLQQQVVGQAGIVPRTKT
jgi:hypothetical protein